MDSFSKQTLCQGKLQTSRDVMGLLRANYPGTRVGKLLKSCETGK
jgi:hypothetical protein